MRHCCGQRLFDTARVAGGGGRQGGGGVLTDGSARLSGGPPACFDSTSRLAGMVEVTLPVRTMRTAGFTLPAGRPSITTSGSGADFAMMKPVI